MIHLDIVSGQLGESGVVEHCCQVLQRTLVDLMGFQRTEPGLGKVLATPRAKASGSTRFNSSNPCDPRRIDNKIA